MGDKEREDKKDKKERDTSTCDYPILTKKPDEQIANKDNSNFYCGE